MERYSQRGGNRKIEKGERDEERERKKEKEGVRRLKARVPACAS